MKYIIVFCLFSVLLSAQQIKHKQLRDDVLLQVEPQEPQSQTKTTKKPSPESQKSTQKPSNQSVQSSQPTADKKTTFIYLEHTDRLSVDEKLRPGAQMLNGNVYFRHDNAHMFCDSAFFYQDENSLDAFGNVRIIQADTIFVYGDVLYYNGNTKLARLRRNVRMENRNAVLTTDSLNYDRMLNLAYYYTGGKIKDELNTLTSVWGQYSPDTDRALFRRNVHLVNPNFTMDADTLKYNTKTNIADIVGPTHIIYGDETDIFSERGWYDTSTEHSMLLNRSKVVHKDGKTLVGDTIFYDKQKSFGEAFRRVELTDSVQKITLNGHYLYYDELTEYGLATDSALLYDWSSADTMYVHADTLQVLKDSVFNIAKGHYNVRIFRNDVQGVCDSLIYSTNDSILNMYGEPVLWAEGSQLSGEHIKIYTKNQQVEQVVIQRSAVASQQVTDEYFNQLSGKEIIAYVDSGALHKIFVNGNAETIYFPVDEGDGLLVGMNKSQSSFVTMYLKEQKMEKILLTTTSTANMYPLFQVSGADLYLRNFFWVEEQRPTDKDDVFRVSVKKERNKPGTAAKAAGNSSLEAPSRSGKNTNDNPPRGNSAPSNRNILQSQP